MSETGILLMRNIEKHQKLQERRSGQDRRNWRCHHEYPYIDSHGILVLKDRRGADDRRKPSTSR